MKTAILAALSAMLIACGSSATPTVSGSSQGVAPTATSDSAIPTQGSSRETTTLKLNLNTAGAEDFLTVPGVGNRMVREFMEYRPYTSILQFRREIGKYVAAAQVAEYEKYVYVPVDVNQADAETLKQLPGVDEAVAADLMAARPYASSDAFLARLATYVSTEQLEAARNCLAAL